MISSRRMHSSIPIPWADPSKSAIATDRICNVRTAIRLLVLLSTRLCARPLAGGSSYAEWRAGDPAPSCPADGWHPQPIAVAGRRQTRELARSSHAARRSLELLNVNSKLIV